MASFTEDTAQDEARKKSVTNLSKKSFSFSNPFISSFKKRFENGIYTAKGMKESI